MADIEYEWFRNCLERLPQHYETSISSYTLVHDVKLDDSPTSSQGSEAEVSGRSPAGDSEDEEVVVLHRHEGHSGRSSADDSEDCERMCYSPENNIRDVLKSGRGSKIVGKPTGPRVAGGNENVAKNIGELWSSMNYWPTPQERCWREQTEARPPSLETELRRVARGVPNSPGTEFRRRRLPEIPKNKKSFSRPMQSSPSLAEELGAAAAAAAAGNSRPRLICFNRYPNLRPDDDSPDSERMATDSGHSTAHSPDNGPKSVSPDNGPKSVSPDSTTGSGGMPFTQLELLEATHRGLHKFVPRHRDEMDVEIGDPIYVQKEADDLWCEGVNLRTGRQGIFPSAYAVDIDYSDFDPSAPKVKKERYLLGYLGSVETLAHKGTSVVCQAVRRIVGNTSQDSPVSQSCILEISDQGLRMVDRSKPVKSSGPCHDYFYSLKNVSFCAFHPRDHRYLGFITKHPTLQRFACHVFIGQDSTRPIAEAVGRAFHRFYTKFIETAFPIEDIYIE